MGMSVGRSENLVNRIVRGSNGREAGQCVPQNVRQLNRDSLAVRAAIVRDR